MVILVIIYYREVFYDRDTTIGNVQSVYFRNLLL